ncbi:cysteine-rich repeat secretory protein 38 [Quercus suber]|uniref:Cysteine-rich repeat secretory protein 38 n=1 Tax=Quercus suber TaxID=58331 RepID=A0AAW0MEY3_QUESU
MLWHNKHVNLRDMTKRHLRHKGSSADIVYGLTICCGDILEKDCKSCIVNAANEIRSHCPNNKGATIWYYYCTLKYHNLDFFGQIDRDTLFFLLILGISDT